MLTIKPGDRVGYAPAFLIGLGASRQDQLWQARGLVWTIDGGLAQVFWEGSDFEEHIDPRYLERVPEPEPAPLCRDGE